MNMQIVAFNEGRFIIADDINKEDLMKSEISLGFSPVLKYRKDNDVVGALLNVEYNTVDKQVLFYGVVVSVYLEGWSEFKTQNPSKEDIITKLTPMWDMVLGFVRGLLAEKTKGTTFDELFLPIINVTNMLESLQIEAIE